LCQAGGLALAAGLGTAAPGAAEPARPVREFRRGGMPYRRLGQTDLHVSVLSFGSHTDPKFKRVVKDHSVLTEEGQARRDRQLARAFDLGVNMVDTYESDGQWEPVARLVRPRRDKVLVSICRQRPMFVGENIDQAARLYGHVDLYRICVGDGSAATGEVLEDWDVLRKARKAGKVRAIGISTHSESMMTSALKELEGLDYIMFPYNFIHARADYSEFLPAAIRRGVGLIAIKPLAAGSIVQLDPKARGGSRPEQERVMLYQKQDRPLLPAVVAQLTRDLGQLPGETLCQAAMRFVYARPFLTCAMPGMFQDQELEDNYAALAGHLRPTGADGKALDAARHLARLRGSSWLPRSYRWLEQWRA
jgi:aryl-alcohol dehydrogenase-like predicted oxidoreductase